MAAQGITVNNVAPGYTATERLDEIFESEQDRADLEGSIPAARFAAPEEVAAAAVFLASQGAAYITGQTSGGGRWGDERECFRACAKRPSLTSPLPRQLFDSKIHK